MNALSLSRVMPVVALAALLLSLPACDRAVPPLVSQAVTVAGTPAVLLPPTAMPVSTATATVTVRAPTPAGGTARPSPSTNPLATTRPATSATVAIPTPAPTATRTPFVTPAQSFRYVVQLDDTLSGIAARFKTTVEVLVLLNNLPGDLIVAGQQLVIPGSPPTATSTPRPPTATATKRPTPRTYVVRTGDSLSLIAKRYGTTVESLMRYNGLRSEVVVPGQIIRIP